MPHIFCASYSVRPIVCVLLCASYSVRPHKCVLSPTECVDNCHWFGCGIQKLHRHKVIMQGKLFQRCAHLLYCSVLSLGGNVNTRLMSKPDIRYSFHINNHWTILVKGNYYVNYQNYQNSMILTFSDTKRTLRHLLLFTNFAQRELVSTCTQSIRNCN